MAHAHPRGVAPRRSRGCWRRPPLEKCLQGDAGGGLATGDIKGPSSALEKVARGQFDFSRHYDLLFADETDE
jgi:hypothetical protein